MKHLTCNKRGSMTVVIMLAVMTFAVSYSTLVMSSAALSNMSRHRKQLENVYTYTSFADMACGQIVGQLDDSIATSPRSLMQDVEVYRMIAQELSANIANGSGECAMYTPVDLVRMSNPNSAKTTSYIDKKLKAPKFQMEVHMQDVLVPDFSLGDRVLDFKTGDYFYFKPIIIQIKVSDQSTHVEREYTLSNIRGEI
ncbi:MAG: hypothetical protein RSC43_05190, partial [Clostridia bacterium]